MSVITMTNGQGIEINVDAETVEAVHETTDRITGLKIGGVTIAVQGGAEGVAKRIEAARGRPVSLVPRAKKNP